MQLFIKNKTEPRSFLWLWILHLVCIVLSLIVLGITAHLASSLHDIGCNSSSKINFNLAVAVISLIAIIYFILSSGPRPFLRIIPWSVFIQLGLDVLLFVFWLAAAATSPVTCSELCNACSDLLPDYVVFDSTACTCFYFKKRDTSPNPQGQLLGKRRSARYHHSGSGSNVAAREAFDAILTVLFAVCIAGTILYFFQQRRQTSAGYNPETSNPTSMPPIKHEEAGMSPAAGTQGYPQQPQPTYNNQMPTQPAYPSQQPMQQPMQQQQVPPAGAPQQQWSGPAQQAYPEQYGGAPGSQPQGAAQQYYSEQSSAGNPREGVAEMHSPGPEAAERKPVESRLM